MAPELLRFRREAARRPICVNVSGQGGRYMIERKSIGAARTAHAKPGGSAAGAARCAGNASPRNGKRRRGRRSGRLGASRSARLSTGSAYGFQEFSEFLNYAQDKLVVRVEPDEEKGLMVYLGAEFYPPAVPEPPPPRDVTKPKRKRSSRSWKASRRCSNRILRRSSRSRSDARAKQPAPGEIRPTARAAAARRSPSSHHTMQ